MKKKDIYLIGGIVIAAVIFFMIVHFVIQKDGAVAVIRVDGKIMKELSLSKNTTVTVAGYEGGENIVVVEQGAVYMQEADCPDKICVHTGKISKVGETIVCLPHRVVVEIRKGMCGAVENQVDSVVR